MPTCSTVPHLQTTLTGPLLTLEAHLLAHQAQIESWFRQQFRNTPAPFYASVDIRNAGYKIAPVDTNLFPAGFNNLAPELRPLAVQAAQSAVMQACPVADGILIIPENHTRNLYYLENVRALQDILCAAGYEVRIGSLREDLKAPESLSLPSGQQLTLEPLIRQGDRVGVDDFFPCAVLLNNDLSSGRPAILEDLDQTLLPPLDMGWVNRYKTHHFEHYTRAAAEFSELIDIDPWIITPASIQCGPVNFRTREGLECLAGAVNTILDPTAQAYAEHGIEDRPFAVVKSDRGTYGMAVMSVETPDEILTLNKKQRHKMSSGKEGLVAHQMMVQEGIYTFEKLNEAVAEPVVYMIGAHVIGGFYRVHTGKKATDNLNAPGMHFEPLSFPEPCALPDQQASPDAAPNRFYAYGVIARLALVAAAREICQTKNEECPT